MDELKLKDCADGHCNNEDIFEDLTARIKELESELAALKESTRWRSVEEPPEKESTEQWEMYECELNRYGEVLIAPLWFYSGEWLTYPGYGSNYSEFVVKWRPIPQPEMKS